MSNPIGWCDTTWNPVRGCTRVSAGCDNCYAIGQAHRFSGEGQPYEGLTKRRAYSPDQAPDGEGEIRERVDWSGKVITVPEKLDEPLRWRKPQRIFVNSMSDLFHPAVPEEFIDQVFAVMALAPQHTFLVLTKRPDRMSGYLLNASRQMRVALQASTDPHDEKFSAVIDGPWPLPNVQLGVSVEDQSTADERIPLLLQTPAAVRWVSCEPMLGPVGLFDVDGSIAQRMTDLDPREGRFPADCIDWVVFGGESRGIREPRPCDIAWIRDGLRQCREAGVPAYVKQLGAVVHDRNDVGFDAEWNDGRGWPEASSQRVEPLTSQEWQGDPVRVYLKDPKGSDPAEWPEDLRVRELPA